MTWPTYYYLKSLVDAEQKKLENNFQTACFFVEPGYPKKGKSATQKAHDIFSSEYGRLETVKKELHDSVAESYKTHPLKGMREFWGLEN